MSATLENLAAGRQQFRRMVWLSAALHGGLSIAAMISWPSFIDHELPAGPVIRMITPAELAMRTASVVPQPKPAPPKVEPQPEPEPVAPPPPPEPELTVIPEDPTQKVKKPEPKPEPEVEPEPAPRPREEKQVDLEQWLAEEKAKEGQQSPIEQAANAKQALPPPGAGGTGAPLTAEVAAWQQKVKAHVRRNWALTPGLRGKGLKALTTVELTASGLIVDFDIERSSGNPWFDDSVERFLEETTSLPAPPDDGKWPIEFEGNF